MSSEGLLANPALFVRNRDADDAYVGARRLAREYLALAEDTGAESSDARGHLFKIMHGGLTARVDLQPSASTASSSATCAPSSTRSTRVDPDGLLEAAHDDASGSSWYWRHRVAEGGSRADPAIVQARRSSQAGRASGGTRRGGRAAAAAQLRRLRCIIHGRHTYGRATHRGRPGPGK